MTNADPHPQTHPADVLGPGALNRTARLGTILVADADAEMRSDLQRLLQPHWQVAPAADGETALQIALEAPPDVILAAAALPGLDGVRLIRHVRASPQLADTPVILLTAQGDDEAAVQGLQAGADDAIAKPFSPRELLARIQGVYARGRERAALRKSEARQAYLVRLGDGLRPLADPVQIQETAAQIAMDYYGADRCYYCEIENEQAIIRRDAARAGLPSVAGVYPLAELPLYAATAAAGAPIVVADTAASAVLDADLKQICIDLEIISFINVPVMKAGRYAGNLCITQTAPRRWTELEVELAVETAERTWAAVERAHAEAALRKSEEIHQFLVRFSDAVRGLADPRAVAHMACRMVAEQLGAERAHWAEIDWTAREFVIESRYVAPGAADTTGGRHPFDAWEPVSSFVLAGQTVVGEDPRRDSRLPADVAERLAARGVTGRIGVPVLLDGTLRAILSVNQGTPRRWTPAEIALVEGVAARCWAEVERARAAAALRESEEKYHTLFDSIDEGFCLIEMIYDETGAAVDYRFLEVNRAFAQRTGLADAAGKLASEVVPGTEAYWIEDYGAVAATGEPLRVENYHEPTGRWYLGYATRAGGKGSRQVAIVFDDITEHKREARQREYLLRLTDALRPLGDPREIQQVAMRLAGEQLQVDCAMYNEIRDEGETIHIEDNYVRAGFPKITGDFPVRRFGAAMDVLQRGEILVVEDQRTTPLKTGTEQAASIGLGVLASATVPLVKGGRWVANFGVLHGSPRRFTPDEIAILQETAERTWAAVGRARAEAALRANEARLEAEVAERTAQVRELVTRLTMSEQEERRRISSLLHDDVQQRLFSFVFLLAALRQALDAGEDANAREIIGDVEAGLQEAIQVTRELSVDLSPPVLHDEGLAEALRWLAALMKLQHGLVVKVRAAPDFPLLGEDLRVLLFQVVRELLFNVVKHAEVQAAAVTLAREGARLLITVQDEGRGFASAAGEGAQGVVGGQGLRRIEQRMKLLGGTMEVAAAPGRGTCVTLVVPLEGEAGR